jgi:hypothetical protein
MQYFEARQASIVEVKFIMERYIIQLLQPHLNLTDIQPSMENGATQFFDRQILEILNFVNVSTVSKLCIYTIKNYVNFVLLIRFFP